MDMIRKPLLATPNQKRSRADDGEWDTIPPSPRNIVTPTTSRKIQTLINVFLINQTLEEGRQELLKNSANRTTKAKDISASPALKKCKKKKLQATRKTKDGDRSLQQKLNIVSTIAGYFEESKKYTTVPSTVPRVLNKDNNNGVCQYTTKQPCMVPRRYNRWHCSLP